jgi:hypothetical protein
MSDVLAELPTFLNCTNFVIAWICVIARTSAAIDGAFDENASKHDAYHIN